MKGNIKKVAIVDAYSTGADLVSMLNGSGCHCIHVQSHSKIPQPFRDSFTLDKFIENIIVKEEKWDNVAQNLATHHPSYVIAGTETGVVLADFLNDRLGLPGNHPYTSEQRRDKFKMGQALQKAGLSAIRQERVTTTNDARQWARNLNQWPVVVKPLDSAGADSVYFCDDEIHVEEAVGTIIGQENLIGIMNKAALLQERLIGHQYFVNAVSINGAHKFTEIWSDDKTPVEGAALICDKEELLPYHGEIQDSLKKYLKNVLDILGIYNGPSHSEIMYTPKGPVLIETAARMQGTILHEAVVKAMGASHVTSTVDRYLDPGVFLKTINMPYKLQANLYCVSLQSQQEGVVVKNNTLPLLSTLPSYYSHFHTPKVGEKIYKTTNLFNNPGIIYLLHPSRAQLETDYGKIREWEKAGRLFELMGET